MGSATLANSAEGGVYPSMFIVYKFIKVLNHQLVSLAIVAKTLKQRQLTREAIATFRYDCVWIFS